MKSNRLFWKILVMFFFLMFLSRTGMTYTDSAQAEIEALKQQVQMLLKRIEELEKKQAKTEKAVEEKALAHGKAYWKNGFRIEYKDPKKNREYHFRFRTGLQFRYTYMGRDEDFKNGNENWSNFKARRVRFFVDGTAPNHSWKYFAHVQLERGDVYLHDAFVIWKKSPAFKVQFGRMKIPAMSIEYWQSGFKQNGTDRTIFTDDSEGYWPYSGTQKLKVGGHLLANGFPRGGMLLFRSQGLNVNGALDFFGKKQFLTYWFGWYNGRDTRGNSNVSDDHLYSWRLAFNILPGSDPRGPLGPGTFNNYFMQGDYGYNTAPALALVLSGFWAKDRPDSYATWSVSGANIKTGFTGGAHDVENYGFDATLLYRYRGFSADIEFAWEEFIQDPDKGDVSGHDEETWNRLGFRINLGYFFVPRKWEVTLKYAYLDRLTDDKLEDALKSGLGLVQTSDGAYAIEDNLQQVVLGLNYYWHGFNQYITFDVSYLTIDTSKPSASELNDLGISPAVRWSGEDEKDWRFRVMYQHWF